MSQKLETKIEENHTNREEKMAHIYIGKSKGNGFYQMVVNGKEISFLTGDDYRLAREMGDGTNSRKYTIREMTNFIGRHLSVVMFFEGIKRYQIFNGKIFDDKIIEYEKLPSYLVFILYNTISINLLENEGSKYSKKIK